MQQSSSWEANISSGSLESSQISWHWKVHYHFQNCLPCVPILSWVNPVYTIPPYLRSTLPLSSPLFLFSKWFLSFTCPQKYHICTSTPHAPNTSLPFTAYEENMKLFIMQFYSVTLYALLGPIFFLSTIFSNHLSLCSSLNVRNKVSYQYK